MSKIRIEPLPEEKGIQPERIIKGAARDALLRLEALRGRISASSGLSSEEKKSLFRELDIIRGRLITLEIPARPAQHKLPPLDLSDSVSPYPGFIGDTPAIRSLLKIASRAARTPYPVLLTGETGTGKEVFARIIHLISKKNLFLPVNCGAIPTELMEAELFGHAKGAFTGAHKARKGKFEQADGGTVFLDEVGELDPPLQVKLLRVLQSGEVQRIGEEKPHRVNVRVIAATNRDMASLIQDGHFRRDLFYRLSVFSLELPPLRERRDEIQPLLRHFLSQSARELDTPIPELSDTLKDLLFNTYDFPGNIRELQNIARAIVTLTPGDTTADEFVLQCTGQRRVSQPGLNDSDDAPLPDILHRLKTALSKTGGSVRQTAEILGLSTSRVYQLCREFGFRAADFRRRP